MDSQDIHSQWCIVFLGMGNSWFRPYLLGYIHSSYIQESQRKPEKIKWFMNSYVQLTKSLIAITTVCPLSAWKLKQLVNVNVTNNNLHLDHLS